MDPATELKTSALGSLMVDGTLEALEPGAFGIVIGRTLAEQLGVNGRRLRHHAGRPRALRRPLAWCPACAASG